jgi:4-hydroxy-tetrahydrodipicolinate synthase
MARQAAAAEATGLLAVTPYYSRPSQDGVVALADAGEPAAAREAFLAVLPAVDLVCGTGDGAPRSKPALASLGLLPGAAMRLPQVPAGDAEAGEVRAGPAAAGLSS